MRFIARAALALIAALPLACTAADDAPFKAGQHYKSVRTVQPPADPARIEVMEVYAYSCPHCLSFEPLVDEWKKNKPADVEFVRQPWTLGNPAMLVRSKAFYAAQMLGVEEKFHKALFGAIHGLSKMMTTPEELRALFVEHTGMKAEEFDGVFTGFASDSRARRGESVVRDFGIGSVPTVVVDGRWYTNGTMAGGGHKQVFAVVDFLVKQARAERKQ